MWKRINDQLGAQKLDNRRLAKYVQKQNMLQQSKTHKTKTVQFTKDARTDRQDSVNKNENTPTMRQMITILQNIPTFVNITLLMTLNFD